MTVSLGEVRELLMTHDTKPHMISIQLQPGSLFILGPKTNAIWKHEIKKRSKANQRFGLTYRTAIETKTHVIKK